ncbi:MAG: hypothetical protein JXR70_18910 [Spirochaetales bacterium]|nr:hypothetical protein [Spirochaetales bacterium]
MIKKHPFAKGNIHENFQKSHLDKIHPLEIVEQAFEDSLAEIELPGHQLCLEISHRYSPLQPVIMKHFQSSVFLSDDPFESLLVYHHFHHENLEVYQLPFQSKALENLAKTLQADLIFSYLGIPFKGLSALLPELLALVKVSGFIACIIPTYWFSQEKAHGDEKKLLAYSKQNDREWLFTEPLNGVAEENGAELVGIHPLGKSAKMPIIDVAYLAGLSKLYKAVVENNNAHLEVADVPDEIDLDLSVLIIKKLKKTVNLNNLFSD